MNCRETRPLLPLFFDGELEARQMRAVALHSTRCAACEGELRELERMQELLAAHVSRMVEEVDASRIWAAIAPRLTARPPSRLQRWRTYWQEIDVGWAARGPALAAIAAVVVLALFTWQREAGPTREEVAVLEKQVDNSAVFDSVQSSVDSVAFVTDAETNTTLLWIMDDAAASLDEMGEGK